MHTVLLNQNVFVETTKSNQIMKQNKVLSSFIRFYKIFCRKIPFFFL